MLRRGSIRGHWRRGEPLQHVHPDAAPEFASVHVGGAEVDAAPDARVVHLLGHLREAPVRARDPKDGRVRDGDGDPIVPEEALQDGLGRAGAGGVRRRILWMGRGAQQRLPGSVGCPLSRACPDGGDRAPVLEPVLDLERGDAGVGARGVQGREEARVLLTRVAPRAGGRPAAAFHGTSV